MSHSNIDRIRLAIGDTDASDAILSDAEIEGLIEDRAVLDSSGGTVSVNVIAAAADAASAAAAHYAREFDFSEDSQSFSRAQRVGHFLSLERELRNRSGGYAVSIGGTTTT